MTRSKKEASAVREEKGTLRERIWSRIEEAGMGRFPGTRGRIPNFVGAEKAAARLEELGAWRRAKRIKANPDSPQAPARKRALEAGKIVYMAVPRLRDRACFIELDPERLSDPTKAASIKGAFELGRQVEIRDVKDIDLVLCGRSPPAGTAAAWARAAVSPTSSSASSARRAPHGVRTTGSL